jgi:hypothetical protein
MTFFNPKKIPSKKFAKTFDNFKHFRIDVTFEMRTVLSRIRLFKDTILNVRHHFILNGKGGEESKIVERQRERVL